MFFHHRLRIFWGEGGGVTQTHLLSCPLQVTDARRIVDPTCASSKLRLTCSQTGALPDSFEASLEVTGERRIVGPTTGVTALNFASLVCEPGPYPTVMKPVTCWSIRVVPARSIVASDPFRHEPLNGCFNSGISQPVLQITK